MKYSEVEYQKLLKKFEKVTKISHFVKQEYLKKWSHDGNSVLVSINEGPFIDNRIDNISHERYMYQLETLKKMKLCKFYLNEIDYENLTASCNR